MNLEQMEKELAVIIQDASLQPQFRAWINNAILEIAADFDLPTLRLIEPATFPVTETSWLFALPETFHKKLFRAADSKWSHITVKNQERPLEIDYLDRVDPGHQRVDKHVEMAAAANFGGVNYLGVYPRATESIYLWFYEKPVELKKPGDSCTCIPPEFHERVIIPRVIIKGYQLLMDQTVNFDPKPLQYWQGKYSEGLYGSPMGPIGLINYLAKIRGGPRRHGGRDPIGPGRFYRGYY